MKRANKFTLDFHSLQLKWSKLYLIWLDFRSCQIQLFFRILQQNFCCVSCELVAMDNPARFSKTFRHVSAVIVKYALGWVTISWAKLGFSNKIKLKKQFFDENYSFQLSDIYDNLGYWYYLPVNDDGNCKNIILRQYEE